MLKHKADSTTFWLKFFNGTLSPTSDSSTHVPAFHDLEPRTHASTPLSLPTHYDLASPFLSKCTPGNCGLVNLSLYLACKLLKTQILISSTSHLAESSYLINTCGENIPALPSRSALTVQNALVPAILRWDCIPCSDLFNVTSSMYAQPPGKTVTPASVSPWHFTHAPGIYSTLH